ncbi:8161_t:CDS:2, partial [Ambispora gerdemannii]
EMGNCCSRRFYEEENGRLKFRLIGGRRYHNISNSVYAVPNDDEEAERLIGVNLDLYHFKAVKTIWGGLFNSPIEEKLQQGAKVIDIGCGTGTWLIDMARQYPKSHFTGIDFSPIFPTEGIPGNLQFIESNLLDGLLFGDFHFDFVHQKFMFVAFTQTQWEEKVIPELVRLTRPGGWIEIVEAEANLTSDGDSSKRFVNAFRDFMVSKEMNIEIEYIPSFLENTGEFSEIRKEKKLVTLGKKGGAAGEATLNFFLKGIRHFRVWLPALMDISPEHYDLLVDEILIEAEKGHTSVNQFRFCGHRK